MSFNHSALSVKIPSQLFSLFFDSLEKVRFAPWRLSKPVSKRWRIVARGGPDCQRMAVKNRKYLFSTSSCTLAKSLVEDALPRVAPLNAGPGGRTGHNRSSNVLVSCAHTPTRSPAWSGTQTHHSPRASHSLVISNLASAILLPTSSNPREKTCHHSTSYQR